MVRLGMEALQRRDWVHAHELLAAAEGHAALDAEALDGLAEAAMWLGDYESSLATRQRAHAAFLNGGNPSRAAMTAIALALHYAARLRFAVASGWYGRAERLLEDQPEGPEHGYLAWTVCLMSIGARQDEPALDAARRTFKIGLHTGDPTLQALGLTFQGYLLVRAGDLDEGMRVLDEGMAAAVTGMLAPFPTSLIFCRMIDTCQLLCDYRRAAEWLEAIDRSPITASITSYPGDCDTPASGRAWRMAGGRAAGTTGMRLDGEVRCGSCRSCLLRAGRSTSAHRRPGRGRGRIRPGGRVGHRTSARCRAA
jgi:tetratricopeptide (TPR) repeat protein